MTHRQDAEPAILFMVSVHRGECLPTADSHSLDDALLLPDKLKTLPDQSGHLSGASGDAHACTIFHGYSALAISLLVKEIRNGDVYTALIERRYNHH